MTNKIKVLVADEHAMQLRFKQLFEAENEAVIVGAAATAEETIQKAKALQPDIVLMDLNLPDMDGFAATEILSVEVPFSGIILMGSRSGHEDLRKAMLAGAKDYIVKPFPSEELFNAINQVYASTKRRRVETKKMGEGKVITVFSPRGGVGKTVLSTNLGVALAAIDASCKVAIVDCNLQFGDVAMALNLMPKASISDMVTDIEHLDEKVLSRYMVNFTENLHILPAPFQPEKAESITQQQLTSVINLLKKHYHYIIVDTAPLFNDIILGIMDITDLLLLLAVPDIMTTKNIRLSLDTLNTLGYPQEKMLLVLNRANSKSGLSVVEIEESLHSKFKVILPNDGKLVLSSINRGIPFLISDPNSILAREVHLLAKKIYNENTVLSTNENELPKKSLFGSFKAMFSKSETS
ncbi:Chemotaxis response regulator protein-glutamate methylesterase [bioreactor metagenome]|uniref:Chemotaxis response regulator protein-glutamate methylesterase n=1 Tax=bioreactor metagenome TaxID=1076179 RepID=A0A644Z9Z1_9ZZZZ